MEGNGRLDVRTTSSPRVFDILTLIDRQNVYESDYNYQYNGDLYTIYASLTGNEPKPDAMNAIEKISKDYQPNVTSGFDVNNFRLIRALGQGMNGSVSRSQGEE